MSDKKIDRRPPPKEATIKPLEIQTTGLSVPSAYVVPVGDLRITQDGVASIICDVYLDKDSYDNNLAPLYSSSFELPSDALYKSALSLANKSV
jgi:hypothetical protein